ncbi:hypothetical protein [Azorhizobium doebereinerae]|uniref:hypothetical protein n=1 Tax=Azorhizobium doebereinerae TaxID=281091 RepID=UPI00042383E3|nr:hypothetical protein [Azorhizobium doebereinerae]
MPISRASTSRLAICLQILLGITLFFLVDAAVFRSGFYLRWISPASSLGSMVRAINDIDAIPDGSKSILVIGDSRIGEGFSAKLADAEAVRSGASVTFTSGGVAGTTPRVWYYLLRQIRDPGKRLAAVAIMTPSFHDNDDGLPADRVGDIVFVHTMLGLADIVDFPASFSSFATRREAATAILFKGLFYKNDILDFVENPGKRVREAKDWRKDGLEWFYAYSGNGGSLAGATLDLEAGEVTRGTSSPLSTILADYARRLQAFHGRPPDAATSTAYRRLWWRRIADLCQKAGVKLLVFRIPRGPFHHMVDADTQPSGVLADLAAAGKLTLLPADAFDNFERPQFFFDDLHLNRAGREAFSVDLTRAILVHLPAGK